MGQKWKLLATAPSEKGILEAIERYYCGSPKTLDHGRIFGPRGVIEHNRVIQKAGRYRFEYLPEGQRA